MTKQKWEQFLISLLFIPVFAFNPIIGLLNADKTEESYPPTSSTPVSDYLNEQNIPYEPTLSDIQLIILEQAVLYGVDGSFALDLAAIESGFSPYARNASSTAKGLFQFLDSTWMNFCRNVTPQEVFNPTLNARCAMRIISEGGINHWLADPAVPRMLKAKGYDLKTEFWKD